VAHDFANASGTTISLNTLYMATLTYNGSDTIKIYINGILDGTKSDITEGNVNINNSPVYIGKRNNGLFLNGLIDQSSVFNTALDSTQVQELFNDGVALDATTHSKKDYLLGYWRNDGISSWIDRAPEKMAFDGTDDRVRYGNLINGFTSLTMASWFRVNTSSSTQNDIIGQFHNVGTIGARLQSRAGSAGIWWATGSGSSSTLAIYSDSGAHRDGNWHHVVGTYDGSTLKLYFDGATTPVATASSSGLTFNDTNGFDIGGTYPEYMDGTIDECALWNTALTGTEVAELYALGLDGNILTHSNQTNLVSYWKNEGITTASWADKKGSNNPSSVAGSPTLIGGNNGTPAGTPDAITIREGLNSNKDGLGFPLTNPTGNVLRLNGVNEYVSIPPSDMSLSSQMTIEFWAKHNTGDSSGEQIVDQYDYNNNQRSYRLSIQSDEKLKFDVTSSGGSNFNRYNSDSAVSNINNWRHYAITFSSGSVIMYVDSAVFANTHSTTDGGTSIFNNTTDNLRIGSAWSASDAGTNIWNGLLDEVRIYNRALSATEVSKNYKHGKGKHKND
jgi:hypothetical protein